MLPGPCQEARSSFRPWWMLGIVGLLQIGLLCEFHYDRWVKALKPSGKPAAMTGEGLVIRSDGLGYYAWLRSLLIDGDWLFDNEFDQFNVTGSYVPHPKNLSPIGRRRNQWSVGPACVWAVTVVPGHFALRWFEPAGIKWRADGYSMPYQFLVGFTTLFCSLAGLVCLYAICRHWAKPVVAALVAGALTLGTTIIYYSALEGSMSHAIGAAAATVTIWYWLRDFGSLRPGRWILLGILVGVTALMRWQMATLAILLVGEAVWRVAVRRHLGAPVTISRILGLLSLSGTAAVLAFFPQLIAWKVVYGSWLASPIPTSHNWLRPSFWQVLFCQDRSFFYWTPVTLVALLGYLAVFLRPTNSQPRFHSAQGSHDIRIWLILAAFALQVYVMASLWGNCVSIGSGYGFRHLTECIVLLAPGLALLIERTPGRLSGWLVLGVCTLAMWNLMLICLYRHGGVPIDGGADPKTMLAKTLWLVRQKHLPSLIFQVILAPLLLWLLSIHWPRTKQISSVNMTDDLKFIPRRELDLAG
jgi:hypothetical protein